MPTDAKLGMVFGVVLVVLVAVLFFRRDSANPAVAEPSAAAVVQTAPPAPPSPAPGARTTGTPVSARKHRVRAGDTLTALARHYLGDAARADDIRRVNPQLPPDTNELTPGQELVLPDGAAATPAPDPADTAEKSAELPH
jgi:nucleoid-associated protein YgaU